MVYLNVMLLSITNPSLLNRNSQRVVPSMFETYGPVIFADLHTVMRQLHIPASVINWAIAIAEVRQTAIITILLYHARCLKYE